MEVWKLMLLKGTLFLLTAMVVKVRNKGLYIKTCPHNDFFTLVINICKKNSFHFHGILFNSFLHEMFFFLIQYDGNGAQPF